MKKVTSTIVAREAGVAQPTVSRVVNNSTWVAPDTRQRVIEAAKRLGYPLFPQTRQPAIGTILSEEFLDNYMITALMALRNEITRRVIHVETIFSGDLGLLNSRVIIGAIAIGDDTKMNGRWAKTTVLPLVRYGAKSSHDSNVYSVYTNIAELIDKSMDYLRGFGHLRVGLLLNYRRFEDLAKIECFSSAFINNLSSCGVSDPEKFISYADDRPIIERACDLLALGVTALIVKQGDNVFELIKGLEKIGLKVPYDLSIIAQECTKFSEYWSPPVTSFSHHYNELASASLDLLWKLIANEKGLSDIMLPGRFIIRDSVAPPPKHRKKK